MSAWMKRSREKQLEGGSRAKKMALIETMNPQWRDLYADFA
jgi:putative endonuclease